jgi:hypothetical protein
MADKLAVMASSPADYERLGLSPTSIAPWEDGARTDDSAGTYEWWYFDAHLADGAKLVVTFMNKDVAEPQKPLSPLLRLDLDLPDGRHFEKLVHYPPGKWSGAVETGAAWAFSPGSMRMGEPPPRRRLGRDPALSVLTARQAAGRRPPCRGRTPAGRRGPWPEP